MALALLAACLLLYTRHNQFPFFYHPDEPDKVEQVMTGKWNFHHPLLMLATSRVASHILRVPQEDQALVVLGRWASATFAALGVASFALLGFRRRGWPGFFAIALTIGLGHQVFELGHYFKEDTALLMALGFTFLAIDLFWLRQDIPSLGLLGVACGLSLSAKYLGVVMVLPALLAICLAPNSRQRRGLSLLLFLGAFLLTAAIANFPLLADFQTFRNSFHREVALVREPSGRAAILEYLKIFVSNTNVAIWVFLGIHLARQWKKRREIGIPEWIELVFPFAFMAILSCSQKTNDRYFLPCTVLFTYLAGLGICVGCVWLKARFPSWVAFSAGLAIACLFQVVQIPVINSHSLGEYYRAFEHDDRAELIDWIRSNLPTNAVIAQDARAALPTPTRTARLAVRALLPQKVKDPKLLANLGPYESLASQGITHVVASESDYGRFYRKAWSAKNSGEAEKRKFYDELFAKAKPLWERPRATVIYLHPGLQLFEVR
jgi:hypothetical protein